MAGRIKEIIDTVIRERSNGNFAIEEMTKAKFILKGINPDKFESCSADDPVIIDKLLAITKQWNMEKPAEESSGIKPVFSIKSDEKEAVSDIKNQLKGSGIKLITFFASSFYDQERLSCLMQEAFQDCIVFGCSTAGEIINTDLLKNAVVAMAFSSDIISDAKVEVVERMKESLNLEPAFTSFERYFNESSYAMDAKRYVGIVLIDGLSMQEEKVMDQIGNRTNVYFIGGSAGDDLKFRKTFVYANGKAYTDATVLVLLKVNEQAEFGIIKTQSFKVLDQVLIANKVHEETREVIEFNNRPAILAYADAVGASSVEETPKYFTTNPVGLVIGENEIFVRSPRQKMGTSMNFNCNLLEGMEVRLLEATDIIENTRNAIEKKISQFGKIEGMINFCCIELILELEKKNSLKQYGELFSGIPTIGFATYGEEYIGHINQTATMLVFKSNITKRENYQEAHSGMAADEKQKFRGPDYERLIKENNDLHKMILERNQQLKETIASLKEFNIMLEDEINERTKREEEIRYLSYHDKLTGLYNRRFYEEEIKRLDTERNLPISIIMGDVNGLKLINDAFGHEKGDELLKKAAAGIQNACRADDIAARWGGDEFVILLPKTKNEEVEGIIHRIRKQYAEERVHDLSISISFGWDTKENIHEDILKVLKRAEDDMYEHKVIENEAIRGNTIKIINDHLYEKNRWEEQHSKNVGELCRKIGKAMGLSEIEAGRLNAVGFLHDIGKIVIDENILNKPDKLSEQEWKEIKRHPDIGYRILSSTDDMLAFAGGILSHHERWDGTGYPRGLKGEAIPLVARIIALADSYDAMISERPYRNALSKQEALEEIKKNMGKQFDPEIAKIFIEKVLKS
ncbi:MAG: Cyclic di-GMP phosphodiesterase response regulator RpfG [Pelotomaculum sp. PtaU1.Bin065]|nr:MAG: Cyclic di-GMP phosphodiesterase response regulator RpfG [Pelotomaculum sp. PtaU1.Bin065]